jgi:hypothetical protein
VPIAIIASGIFAVSGVASVLQVWRDDRARELKPRRRGFGWLNAPHRLVKRWGWLEAVPGQAVLESLTFRLNAIILNFTVVNLYVQGLHSYSGLK